MNVTVIIPTYNAANLLEENLSLVFNTLKAGDEVLVIDDASTDETVIWLINTYRLHKVPEIPDLTLPKNYLPKIADDTTEMYQGEVLHKGVKCTLTLVINTRNSRFAASCNKAAALAKFDWLFLLNNDVKPDRDSLQVLRQLVARNSNIFAIGCIEYDDKKRLKASGKNKLWFERGLYLHSKSDEFNFGPTAWVSGGSGLYSREKWLALLGFDLAFYPAYWEDIDLSYRARERGWQVLFSPEAVVFHKHETTNVNVIGLQKINEISWRHAQYFTWKHSNLIQKLQFILWLPYWTVKRYLQ